MKKIFQATAASIFLSLFALTALAAEAPKAKTQDEVVVADTWYTVTIAGKTKYGYYNDKIVRRGDQLFFQNRYWKSEEGFINEEALGAIAKDDADLTPLVFNFQSKYRNSETKIDGSLKDGELTVKIKKGGKELPLVKRTGIKNAIFSVFFPVWLGKKFNEMKVGQTLSYLTILEDNIDQNFSSISGWVRQEKDDEFAIKNKAKKLAVTYRDLKSTWYILPSGTPIKIHLQDANTTIERVSEKVATQFLKP
ncbi:MAG: hypothetical protein JNL01_11325 [Bdellovibrionales bacterium]|nr:hypothetical protein [Bdellovibrionales bacterium]